MASWCGICRRKVDASYTYYKGMKVHQSCKKKALEKKQEKSND